MIGSIRANTFVTPPILPRTDSIMLMVGSPFIDVYFMLYFVFHFKLLLSMVFQNPTCLSEEIALVESLAWTDRKGNVHNPKWMTSQQCSLLHGVKTFGGDFFLFLESHLHTHTHTHTNNALELNNTAVFSRLR